MHKRTIVSSPGNGLKIKWKFELQYSDNPDKAGFYQAHLISKNAQKLFYHFLVTKKNIIEYLRELIIDKTKKLKPTFKFEKISCVEIGECHISLKACFASFSLT
jgi:hypothetical protein